MSLSTILAFLQSLLPLLGPELASIWQSDLVPVIQKWISSLNSIEQVLANAAFQALNNLVIAEIGKI